MTRPTLRRHLWLCALALAPWAARADPAPGGTVRPLQWVAGDLPPFAWRSSAGPRGYAQELVQLMGQRLGRDVDVDYFPWARAVQLTERSDNTGVFPLARTPDREARFQWLVPLMTVRYVFLTAAGERRLGLAELRTRRVGVLRGSPIVANLRAERFTTIIEGKDYKDLLRLLAERGLDAVYAGGPMLDAALAEYGYPAEQFTPQQSLGEARLYIAASPGLAPAEAQRWLQAYEKLVEDGSVERLRRRYFPTERH